MDVIADENNEQIVLLLDKAYAYRTSDLNQSKKLANEALALSKKTKNNIFIGKSLSQLALYAMIQGEYESSMAMSEQAIKYFEELNDEKGIADAKYNIAGVYYKTDNFHLGLVYLIDCLGTYRKFNDYHNQARVEKSLGTIYEYFGDQKNAIKSYEDSIESSKKAIDISLESNAYNPLSGVYLKKDEPEKALELIERAILMKNQTGDLRGLAFSLYGRAKVYSYKKKYDKAEADFEKAITIHQEMGERLGLGMAYQKFASMYVQMGAFDKAKIVLKKGYDLSEKYNIVIIKFKCNFLFYQIFKKENNPVQALKYLERYLQQKEAAINTQTLKVIENYELLSKMETLELEARLQLEKADIIAEKDKAEQQALVKQEFLSTMSHEIRTPLNAVITIAALLGDKVGKKEKQFVDSLKFAANNLLLIINDILDFTKLENGKASLELRPTNFCQLLENIKRTYENLAKEKGLQLLLNIDSGVSESYEMDETKFSQIIGNLLTNAIKFTDAGSVNMQVEKTGSSADEYHQLRFKIIDTGTGIAGNHLQSIFESFSQPKSITTRKQGGSGLGLAIVKKLVALHNSTVEVLSTVGEGSVFYFDLSLKCAKSQVKAPITRSDLLQNKTVLLAEDNMINAMVAMKLLSNWKMKAEHANDGLKAVEKANAKGYDFILMDIHMPEMDGFEATKNIRCGAGHNCYTPIFALTADITAEHKEEYMPYFDGFLRKPIEIDKLYEAMVNKL
ncbi:signal transduction histidine kinase [Mucilaginibacter gracilis]|uniref:histidine kinase n=1 Tax=Mucilaginibacter gracilis TaxID=423350 RepID=A0A495IX20_9SPHI|nr:tetratricopeptide repeat protein [Mucilaginibacter gracilis]RKR81220.1 signal transduction histidine kinase [Mucilaginibacter gracilis]